MSIIEKAMEKARQGSSQSPEAVQPRVVPQPAPQSVSQPASQAVAWDKTRDSTNVVRIDPVPELVMCQPQTASLGGSYRLLKERLLAIRKERPDMNLFMISSSMRAEGKTVVSVNLAAAMALEFDHTVLLVDADLRAPSCHKMFGIPGRPKGLADCLLYDVPFSDVVMRMDLGKLSLLCAGSATENPSELFTSNRMQNFLLEIKHRYPDRIIILDTVPLLPFAESRALTRVVDGIVLVVREKVTAKAHLESTLRVLDGRPLLGIAYNGSSSYGADKEIFELVYGY